MYYFYFLTKYFYSSTTLFDLIINFCSSCSDEILSGADQYDVAFLVVGDPLGYED